MTLLSRHARQGMKIRAKVLIIARGWWMIWNVCMQDHMRGRRHARRLQYIRNMPESERTPFMERVASGETCCIRLATNVSTQYPI